MNSFSSEEFSILSFTLCFLSFASGFCSFRILQSAFRALSASIPLQKIQNDLN